MSKAPKNLVTRSAGSVSYNEETGTVDIVYSTGARRELDGIWEELVVSEDAIDTSRIDAGAVSLIIDHVPYGLPIGNVVGHRIENGQAVATVKLSVAPENAGIVADIRAGIIRQVSVGYVPKAFEDRDENGVIVRTVTEWQPWEISLVVMPADPAAHIRSAGAKLNRRSEENMDPEELLAQAQAALEAAQEKLAEVAESGDEAAIAEAQAAVDAAQAEVDAAQEAVDAGAEGDGDGDDETRSEAETRSAAEQTRVEAIYAYATRNHIPAALVAQHITQRRSLEEVRDLTRKARAERSAAPITTARTTVTRDERETLVSRIADGLTARMTKTAPTDRGRQFMGYSLRDIAQELVGRSARGMSPRQLFNAALETRSGSGSHSTSDFAVVLSTSANKALLDRYQAAPKNYEPMVRRVQHSNYKEVEKFRIGDAPKFKRRPEGGEVEFGTMSENAERFRIHNETAGISFTYELFVNDELDAFGDLTRSFGGNAALREAELVYGILIDGYKMADGKQLFHATRGNLINNTLSIAGLDAGMTAMETQKSLDGNVIGITPAILLVGPKNRLTGQRLLANIAATNVDDVNPFGNSNIKLVVDPRITDMSWFLIADPVAYDGIQLASLAGSEGVSMETIENHYKRSIDFIASIDVGAAPIDYRPLLKSTGTGA